MRKITEWFTGSSHLGTFPPISAQSGWGRGGVTHGEIEDSTGVQTWILRNTNRHNSVLFFIQDTSARDKFLVAEDQSGLAISPLSISVIISVRVALRP